MTKKLRGMLDYTYSKSKAPRADEKEAQEGQPLLLLWRPEKSDEALKAGAIPSLSVGLQGPGHSAFRSISLSGPVATMATRSVDEHELPHSLENAWAWSAADSGIDSSIHRRMHTTITLHSSWIASSH